MPPSYGSKLWLQAETILFVWENEKIRMGSNLDLLPELNRTDFSMKWPRIGRDLGI